MAFFGVTIETLSQVQAHPNADRLDVGQCQGLSFQFVLPRGQYKARDRVLYFPLDSLLPDWLLEKVGLVGKLSGAQKNRVKTLTLRGEISQGLVLNLDLLPPELQNKTPEEITAYFEVKKYEAPEVLDHTGRLLPLPQGYGKYDIEGADRFQYVVDYLMDKEVVVHEKMEGQNWAAGKTSQGLVFVNSRNYTIEELEGVENALWKIARHLGVVESLKSMEGDLALYAEFCGPSVQQNIYKLPRTDLYVFDAVKDFKWLGFDDLEDLLAKHFPNLKKAPLLFRGRLRDYLAGESVQTKSNGKSQVNPLVLREGIVIKPVKEEYLKGYGRVIIKQRSPEYLNKTDL